MQTIPWRAFCTILAVLALSNIACDSRPPSLSKETGAFSGAQPTVFAHDSIAKEELLNLKLGHRYAIPTDIEGNESWRMHLLTQPTWNQRKWNEVTGHGDTIQTSDFDYVTKLERNAHFVVLKRLDGRGRHSPNYHVDATDHLGNSHSGYISQEQLVYMKLVNVTESSQ